MITNFIYKGPKEDDPSYRLYEVHFADFKELVELSPTGAESTIWIHITRIAERRGLSVAACLISYAYIPNSISIESIIQLNEQNNPLWDRYRDDVLKLLALV